MTTQQPHHGRPAGVQRRLTFPRMPSLSNTRGVMAIRKSMGRLTLFPMAGVVISLAAVALESRAAVEIPLSKARMIIEYNATAEDVGVQVLLDGEPWKNMAIFSPDGRRLLQITNTGSLKTQGLTELFFESSEPSLAEVPLEEFLARFPQGVYDFEGRTTEGEEIEGEATFTHVIPAAPVVVSPPEGAVVDPNNFVIDWNPVTQTLNGSGVQIIGYQVIIGQVEPLRELLIDLPATVTSLKVPPEFFLQKDTVHVFEVLAIEAGRNQTITAGEFKTAP